MKKIFFSLLALIIIFSFVSCKKVTIDEMVDDYNTIFETEENHTNKAN